MRSASSGRSPRRINRTIQANNLEAPYARLRELMDFAENALTPVNPLQIARERTRYVLQRDVFNTPIIGDLLKRLLQFKLNMRYEGLHYRRTQWSSMSRLLNQILDAITNEEQRVRQTTGDIAELTDVLDTLKEQIQRMFGETTPYYFMLRNDIASANTLRQYDQSLINRMTEAEQFASMISQVMNKEIALPTPQNIDFDDNENVNQENLNMRFRQIERTDGSVLLQLERAYMDNLTLTNSLLSQQQWNRLRNITSRSPQLRDTLYSRIGRLLRAMISKDQRTWSVTFDTRSGFTRQRLRAEVMFRLFNSIRRFQIADSEHHRAPFVLTLELENDNRMLVYALEPFTINHLLVELLNRHFNPVMTENDEMLVGSDNASTIVRNMDNARKISFGPLKETLSLLSPRFRALNRNVQPLIPVYFERPLSSISSHVPISINELLDNPLQLSDREFDNMIHTFELRSRRPLSLVNRAETTRIRNTNFQLDHMLPTYTPLYKRTPLNTDFTGGFFPFFNISEYDLLRYQIPKTFKDLKSAVFDDNCIIHALKKASSCSDTLLRELSTSVATRTLDPAKMTFTLNKFNLKLVVKKLNPAYVKYQIMKAQSVEEEEGVYRQKFRNTKFIVQEFGNGTNVVNLCLVAKHYFLDELTCITGFSFNKRDLAPELRTKKHYNYELGCTYTDRDLIYRTDKKGDNIYYRKADLNQDKFKKYFMLSSELISSLYIEHCISPEKNFAPMYFTDVACFPNAMFKELRKNRRNVEITNELRTLYFNGMLNNNTILDIQNRETRTLIYTPENSTKRILPPVPKQTKEGKKEKEEEEEHFDVFYADFETCVSDSEGKNLDKHIPFMCCISDDIEDSAIQTFIGEDCGKQVLDWLVGESQHPLVYFHNLSYDLNFLMKFGIYNTINRNSSILQADVHYKGISIRFKDSYGLLPMKLKTIALSFKLPVQKEVFPYKFYSPERIEKALKGERYSLESDVYPIEQKYEFWNENIRDEMKQNIINDLHDDPEHFDILKYCEFYCSKDVLVLKKAMNLFHDQLMDSFSIDCHKVLSISSIANKFLENQVYFPNKNLYYYSNHIRDFLLEAVHGGRVMCARNERHHFVAKNIDSGLVDFDAVSLYPSAMSKLYIVEGMPTPLESKQCNIDFLSQDHITAYVVEIFITAVHKPKDFPLVIYKDPKTNKITNTNEPPVRMVVCDIELEDLIEFQSIEFFIIRGLYWTGKKDKKVREVVKNLFETRAQLKREKNSLENTYKLLMNSIYGKTIQKSIDYKYRYLNLCNKSEEFFEKNIISFTEWFKTHTEYIREISCIKDSSIIRLKETKPINSHFNNTLFGVHILAMSKRLMNRVMCLADDLNLDIYYQDTDSMHIRKDQLPILQAAFRAKYQGKELIGTKLCQFHPDFDPIAKDSDPASVVAIESYFLGKKMYIDKLTDSKQNIGHHIRMKGVSNTAILETAKNEEFESDVMNLYKDMFNGREITFDLCAGGGVKFENNKNGEVKSREHFFRKTKATCPIGTRTLEELHQQKEAEKEDLFCGEENDELCCNFLAELYVDFNNSEE